MVVMTRGRRAELSEQNENNVELTEMIENPEKLLKDSPRKKLRRKSLASPDGRKGLKIDQPDKEHALATFCFTTGVSAVYAVAYMSFAVQVTPLFSCKGLAEPLHPLVAPIFNLLSLIIGIDFGAAFLYTTSVCLAIVSALYFFNALPVDEIYKPLVLKTMVGTYMFYMIVCGDWITLSHDYFLTFAGVCAVLLNGNAGDAYNLVRFGITTFLALSVLIEGGMKMVTCPGWSLATELVTHPYPLPTAWHLTRIDTSITQAIDLFLVLLYIIGPVYTLSPSKTHQSIGLLVIGFLYLIQGVTANHGWTPMLGWICITAVLRDADLSMLSSEFLLKAWGAPKIVEPEEDEEKKPSNTLSIALVSLSLPAIAFACLYNFLSDDISTLLGLSQKYAYYVYHSIFAIALIFTLVQLYKNSKAVDLSNVRSKCVLGLTSLFLVSAILYYIEVTFTPRHVPAIVPLLQPLFPRKSYECPAMAGSKNAYVNQVVSLQTTKEDPDYTNYWDEWQPIHGVASEEKLPGLVQPHIPRFELRFHKLEKFKKDWKSKFRARSQKPKFDAKIVKIVVQIVILIKFIHFFFSKITRSIFQAAEEGGYIDTHKVGEI